jgi:hypothetical protein
VEVEILYIYPDNLKSSPTLWLWRLKDMTIGGLLAVFGVAMLAQFKTLLFAAIAAMYLFLMVSRVCLYRKARRNAGFFLCPKTKREDK